MPRALLLRALLPAAIIAMVGCGADPSAVYPSRLSKVQEISRVGVPGWFLVDTLRVRSIGEDGNPRLGQFLNWSIKAGNGSVRLVDEVTNSDGYARAILRLGTSPGMNTIEVEGDGSTISFEVKGTSFTAEQVDATWNNGCALRHGDLWCWLWGRSVAGASLDTMTSIFDGAFNALPTLVSSDEEYIDLAMGGSNVCVLNQQHLTRCFSASGTSSPITAPPLSSIVASDNSYFCGSALADSSTWCWNGFGSLASQVDSTALIQIRVSGSPSGGSHCGLLADSTAMCWGINPPGDGSTNRPRPVAVAGGMKFSQLTMSDEYACGRRTNSEVWCWGRGGSGQIGLPPGVQTLVPVLAMRGAGQVASGIFALAGLFGVQPARLGYANFVLVTQPTPFDGFGFIPVVAFAKGSSGCVLSHGGQVYCVAEHWNTSSQFLLDRYVSVQPIPEQADE